MSHTELAGVHAIGFHRDEGLGCKVLVHFESTKRGFLSRRVTIEGEDHFSAVGFPIAEDDSSGAIRAISQEAPDNFYVVFTESGTAACHRISHTGGVGSHDVRVAFDDNDLAVSCNFFLRKIEAIEDLRLVINRGFRGVEVLRRILVFVVQTPGAKANRRTRNVADWPHESAAETIIEAAVSASCKTCNLDFLIGKALGAQVTGERIPRTGRIADSEVTTGRFIKASLAKETTSFVGFWGRELRLVELLGNAVRVKEPLTATGFLAAKGSAARGLVTQSNPGFEGERFHGLGEGKRINFLDETDDVPTFAAAKAMPKTLGGADVERGRAFVVERAQSF